MNSHSYMSGTRVALPFVLKSEPRIFEIHVAKLLYGHEFRNNKSKSSRYNLSYLNYI